MFWLLTLHILFCYLGTFGQAVLWQACPTGQSRKEKFVAACVGSFPAPAFSGTQGSVGWIVVTLIVQNGWNLWSGQQSQAATNPLSDSPGQLKIHLGDQKFKVLCPNGQLKSEQETECELKVCNYFWYFNWCGWHFISNQVGSDSFKPHL